MRHDRDLLAEFVSLGSDHAFGDRGRRSVAQPSELRWRAARMRRYTFAFAGALPDVAQAYSRLTGLPVILDPALALHDTNNNRSAGIATATDAAQALAGQVGAAALTVTGQGDDGKQRFAWYFARPPADGEMPRRIYDLRAAGLEQQALALARTLSAERRPLANGDGMACSSCSGHTRAWLRSRICSLRCPRSRPRSVLGGSRRWQPSFRARPGTRLSDCAPADVPLPHESAACPRDAERILNRAASSIIGCARLGAKASSAAC